jgi:hypothetical protein
MERYELLVIRHLFKYNDFATVGSYCYLKCKENVTSYNKK